MNKSNPKPDDGTLDAFKADQIIEDKFKWNPKSIDGLADYQNVCIRADDLLALKIELPKGQEKKKGGTPVDFNVAELRRQFAKLGIK